MGEAASKMIQSDKVVAVGKTLSSSLVVAAFIYSVGNCAMHWWELRVRRFVVKDRLEFLERIKPCCACGDKPKHLEKEDSDDDNATLYRPLMIEYLHTVNHCIKYVTGMMMHTSVGLWQRMFGRENSEKARKDEKEKQ
jgi:hypothetical protein